MRLGKAAIRMGAALIASAAMAPAATAQGAKLSSALDIAAAPRTLKPGQWVWAPQIAPDGPVLVLVDLSAQLAFVYRNGVAIGVSTISSGKPGHETPTGVFAILQKDADHRSSTYNNAPMFFQERLTWDGVALHAGGLPGYPESHGCIHLPYSFARELFKVTALGGTVVVTGRAGAPVRSLAGGVLAPADEHGGPAPHQTLAADQDWAWTDPPGASGPVSIVISTTDQRMVVLRNGREIGRARAEIDGQIGTHVAILHRDAARGSFWMLVGAPGHESEANQALDATVLHRLRLPAPFLQSLQATMVPGTSILVTSAAVGAHNSGRQLTVLSALAADAQPRDAQPR